MEGPVGDATQYLPTCLDNCHTSVAPIEDQPGNVLFGHIRQLLAENVFQCDKPAQDQLYMPGQVSELWDRQDLAN